MARGFVAGGLAFGSFGLACAVLTAWVPMWLVSRTELIDRFCWFGEGIFATSYRWGDDIPSLGLECSPSAGHARSTYEAYCAPAQNPTLDGGRVPMSERFRSEMCARTSIAQILIVAAMAMAAAALACGMLAHATLRFRLQIYSSIGATLCATAAFLLVTATFVVMQTSPLFGQDHVAALSTGFGLPYKGVSCMYQMPSLRSVWDQRNFDGRMQCLFPGPSFALALGAMIGSLFSAILFGLKWREAALLRHIALAQHLREPRTWAQTQSPLFGANVALPLEDVESRGDDAAGGCEDADLRTGLLSSTLPPLPEGSEAAACPERSSFSVRHWADPSLLASPGLNLPPRFKFDRHYSLYGAFLRKWQSRSIWPRRLLNAIPPLLNITHVVVLGLWIMNGTAFGNLVEVDEIPHKHRVSFANTSQAQRLAGLMLQDYGKSVAEGSLPPMSDLTFKDLIVRQHMIEFSPITTLQAFFDAGAVWFGLIQLVSIFIWPCAKVLIWAMLWYSPADETLRGRIYSWVDALGKISLANVYILVILCLSNYFERVIVVPWYLAPLVIRPFHALRVRISFAIQPGFGTYGYAISFMLSLFMGEANIGAHRLAKQWEERRRDEECGSWRPPGQRQPDYQQDSRDDLFQRRAYEVPDTPYQMMADAHVAYARAQATSASSAPLGPRPTTVAPEDAQANGEHHDEAVREGSEVTTSTTRLGRGARAASTQGITAPPSSCASVPPAARSVERQMAFYKVSKAEACQDHMFSPIPGKFYRCTLFGKLVVFVLLVAASATMIIGLQLPIFSLERSGIIGSIIIPRASRNESLSVLALPDALHGAGLHDSTPAALSFGVVLFVIFMPLVHLLGLSLLWIVPWSPRAQPRLMHFIEVVNAWSAADVFCLMMVAGVFDLRSFTTQLIENAGFRPLDSFLEKYIPSLGAFTIQEMRLLPGFAVLVAAVLLERALGHLIQLMFATMIAERRGLQEVASQAYKFRSVLHELRASNDREEGSATGATHPSMILSNERLRTNLAVLSPTSRYVLASAAPSCFYAGLPLFVWRIFALCGILRRDYSFEMDLNDPEGHLQDVEPLRL